MTSEELLAQANKQREVERYDAMVSEYLRIKKLVADSGALAHDECCAIALEICEGRGIFVTDPRFR